MATSGSEATRGRGKWTLVDQDGNLQGSDSEVGSSSSSDCVAVEEDLDSVHYRSKRTNSKSSLGSSPGPSPGTSPGTMPVLGASPATRPKNAHQMQNEGASSSATSSWLGSLWTMSSSTAPANQGSTESNAGNGESTEGLASPAQQDGDDIDTESESIEVISMPCDSHSEVEDLHIMEDDGNDSLTLDPSSSSWLETGSAGAAVQPLSSTDALTPIKNLSPSCSQVGDIGSSSSSSQLGFLLLDHNGSRRGTPSPQPLEGAVGGIASNDKTSAIFDEDELERAIGRVGPLPTMPSGELPMSSVSVENIPRGVERGGSPRRAQSTGSIPKESAASSVDAPIMTQRWPTEDGGFLLVQQFRGDGQPEVEPEHEPALSRSSSFSDLSSSFSYPGVRRRIPASSRSSLQHQSSSDFGEDAPYSETSNDELPANMTMSGVTPGIRQYQHRRDESLNNKLTMAAFLVVTAALALVIGHYIGSSQATTHHLGIEAGQVLRLRSLQDQLVSCLDKTRAILKGSKVTNSQTPAIVTVTQDLNHAAKDPGTNVKDPTPTDTTCSLCLDESRPDARYSELCNVKCKEQGLSASNQLRSETINIQGNNTPEAVSDESIMSSDAESQNGDLVAQGKGISLPDSSPVLSTCTNKQRSNIPEVFVDKSSTPFITTNKGSGNVNQGEAWPDAVVPQTDLSFSEFGNAHSSRDESFEMSQDHVNGNVQEDDEGIDNADDMDSHSLNPGQVPKHVLQTPEDSDTKEVECVGNTEEGTEAETDMKRCEEMDKDPADALNGKDYTSVDDERKNKLKDGKDYTSAFEDIEEEPIEDETVITSDFEADEEDLDEDKQEQKSGSEADDEEFEEDKDDETFGFESDEPSTEEVPLMSKLSSKISDSWLLLRNLTSDLVGSASNLSVNNVTSQLKENVESLRHQIKDAVSNLQKSNITSQFKENAQTLGEHLKEAVSSIQKSNITSQIRDNAEALGGHIKDVVSSIQKSNITSKIKDGAQTLGGHLKDAMADISKSNISSSVKEAVQEMGEQISGVLSGIQQANLTSHIKKGLQEAASSIKENSKNIKKHTMKAAKDFIHGKPKKNKKEQEKRGKNKHDNNGKGPGKHSHNGRPQDEAKRSKTKTKGTAPKAKTTEKKKKHNESNKQEQRGSHPKKDHQKKKSKRELKLEKQKDMLEKKEIKASEKLINKVAKESKYDQEEQSKRDRDFNPSTFSQEMEDKISQKKTNQEQKNGQQPTPKKEQKEEMKLNDGIRVDEKHGQFEKKGMHYDNEIKSKDKHNTDRQNENLPNNGEDIKKKNEQFQKNKERFQNVDLDELFESFDVRCHGVHDCLRKQREAALKLYQELLHYQDWLTERCYKKHLEELDDFMEELEEFLAEPSVTDRDLMELMEDFEDMAEDLEEATTKSFRKFMKGFGLGFAKDPSSGKHRATKGGKLNRKDGDGKEETLTVTLDFNHIFNLSSSAGDDGSSSQEDTVPEEKRKHAGYGYQSNDDWFIRRMHDRENMRHEHEEKDTKTDQSDSNNDWYEKWMKGRKEGRSKMTVWDLYQWFSKRQALRHEWRLHEMDDQSNWFLRRP